MKEKRTSAFENGLIWFGAAVSIAEIMTGTYIAPLGIVYGTVAILTGHFIGCVMLFLVGLIGGKTRKSSMETVKSNFGVKGALLFAVINIVQLAGWTAIMIYDGSLVADSILNIGNLNWCIIIGILIILWIIIGVTNLGKVNTVTMSALFVLTILLSIIISGKEMTEIVNGSITFGGAVELSVAMPLSWLPLISDYTKDSEKPVKATAVSAITYGIVSCWMYIIGMCATLFTGESDISGIMIKAGLGLTGLVIVVLSTVTTTFLDAYSAGVSGEAITKKIKSRDMAVFVTVIGAVGAIFFPITDITDFLYFIGSVFAPMIAVQIADFYILKRNNEEEKINYKNLFVWFIGFVIYRLLMKVDIFFGSTLLDVVITITVCVIVNSVGNKEKK